MPTQKETNNDAFVLKDFIITALSYKYLYIASCIVFVAIALFINKVSPKVYGVDSVMGPIEDQRPSLLGSNNMFSGMAEYTSNRNLENDINSLNSFSLVSSTIKQLNMEIGYFTERKIIFTKAHQFYPDSPFFVNIDKSHVQPIDLKIYIQVLNDKSFRIKSSGDDVTYYNYVDNNITSTHNSLKIDTVCNFNETIKNRFYKFSITFNKSAYTVSKDGSQLYFVLYHQDKLANNYLGRLKVSPVSLKSSLIKVAFQGENSALTIDFLNRYLQAYVEEDLSKKNEIAKRTVDFIESQISGISDSLTKSESKLKEYRSVNQVTDLSYQGQQAIQEMSKIESDRSANLVQEQYYNYILDYFDKNEDGAGLAPPSSNVIDPIMSNLITEFMRLNSEKSAIQGTGKNLFLGELNQKIALQRTKLIENVRNSLNTLSLAQNELTYRAEKLSREISKLPRTELNMVSMQRNNKIADAIYTFLLQKRSEAIITLASNIPDYEILEPARETSVKMLSPKTKINLLAAIFLAFLTPTAFFILKDFFNEKISRVRDVEQLIGKPVFSVIYSNSNQTEAAVHESPGSPIAESFRNLRSSLFLRFKTEPVKVMLITSSQPKDGKSFISFNLAASIASVGYKTVVLDCDLRRPTLHEKFGQDNSSGISNYMLDKVSKEEILKSTFIKNLSFIPAGPVLPNSSELIESGALDELIGYLKKHFEYIIIDTTPSGIVADAALMIKYSNINLLVCRNNFTRKDVLSDVLSVLKTNRVTNFDVVFNDLNIKESRYGRYNNYYKKA